MGEASSAEGGAMAAVIKQEDTPAAKDEGVPLTAAVNKPAAT